MGDKLMWTGKGERVEDAIDRLLRISSW